MADWSVSPLQEADIEEFAAAQMLAFVGNSLHDIVYPDEVAAVKGHQKGLKDQQNQAPGNEILYLKATDNPSGKIIGGIKVIYYGAENVSTNSPYAEGIAEVSNDLSEDERYRQFVKNAFLGKRVEDIKGRHSLIDLLFVHPDHHRRGVGRELVSRAGKLNDEKGLSGIVEASPTGQRTYELNGYVNMGPVTIVSETWPGKPDHLYYWMEREARKSS